MLPAEPLYVSDSHLRVRVVVVAVLNHRRLLDDDRLNSFPVLLLA
jgi:hypothetical protein